jgi:hypothetical protein
MRRISGQDSIPGHDRTASPGWSLDFALLGYQICRQHSNSGNYKMAFTGARRKKSMYQA